MYPAPVAPLYGLVYWLGGRVLYFEISLVAVMLAVAALFAFSLRRQGTSLARSILIPAGALVLSYPAAFELRQGNMELFVFLLIALGVWMFVRGNLHTAAVCIGIAGAMKIFPFVYLGLYLARRRYLPLVTAAVTTVLVTVLSLRYLNPSVSVAWHGIQAGLAAYQERTAAFLFVQTSYDHSLFALVKLFLTHVHANHREVASPGLIRMYLATVALGGIVLFFTRIVRLPLINQVLCLSVASILLPPVSFDYTLINLYVPWALLVLFALRHEGIRTPGLAGVFLWLAVTTSIETEFIHNAASLGGQIKAVTLCALMLFALVYPFEDAEMKVAMAP
jgi:hypothetical protein